MMKLFTTGFCAPCRRARQILDYANQNIGAHLEDINISDHPEVAEVYQISATPTIVTDTGERFVGVPSLSEARQLLAVEVESSIHE